jgi:uncharacterized protein (DUF2141 family)
MRLTIVAAALLLSACGSQTAETNDEVLTDDPAMTAPASNMDMGANMAAAGSAGAVTVNVSGVRANGGPVLVALQREGDFAKQAAAYTAKVDPTGTSVTATISGVTPGSYAAAVVQDTNNDGTFTIGETGPTEPFGFSGSNQSGAPTFGPAAFDVAETGGSASVTLSGGE